MHRPTKSVSCAGPSVGARSRRAGRRNAGGDRPLGQTRTIRTDLQYRQLGDGALRSIADRCGRANGRTGIFGYRPFKRGVFFSNFIGIPVRLVIRFNVDDTCGRVHLKKWLFPTTNP